MTLEAKKRWNVRSNLRLYRLCGFNPEDYPEKEYLVSGMTKRSRTLSYGAFGSAGRKNDGNDLQRGCRRVRNGRARTVVGRKVSETEVVIVAGVTAALSGAARLGAPLMNDFAVISLSDLLTPKGRDREAAPCGGAGDFPFVCTIRRAKAGGLFKLGVPDCIRVLCTGYALWLGADDRKTG